MFKTIMVPTDGSKNAQKAEDVAISIARNFQAILMVVHIIDEKLIYPFEVLEEDGKKILERVTLKGKDQGVDIQQVLIVGNPTHDMAKIVEKTGADLVVIGTHGKSGLQKLLMGSVAENTIKTVKIPVLLVK
ncbi:MAG: Universal stress protein [Methanobacterium sp. PtaU1.Bin242]|nr:MAG: Universal stress protein [Methanobacterium sp. PtaU1.Bin242]